MGVNSGYYSKDQGSSRGTSGLADFDQICKGYGHDVDVGEVLRAVLKLVRKYRVRVDVNYATLIINLLCLESMARSLEPEYNVLDRAKPILKPHANPFVKRFFKRLFPLFVQGKKSADATYFRLLKLAKEREIDRR